MRAFLLSLVLILPSLGAETHASASVLVEGSYWSDGRCSVRGGEQVLADNATEVAIWRARRSSGFEITSPIAAADGDYAVIGQLKWGDQSTLSSFTVSVNKKIAKISWDANIANWSDSLRGASEITLSPPTDDQEKLVKPNRLFIGNLPDVKVSLVGMDQKITALNRCDELVQSLVKQYTCAQELGEIFNQQLGCNVEWRLAGSFSQSTIVFVDNAAGVNPADLWLFTWTADSSTPVNISRGTLDCALRSYTPRLEGTWNKQDKLVSVDGGSTAILAQPKSDAYKAFSNICDQKWLSPKVGDPAALGRAALAENRAKEQERRVFGR